MVVKAAVLPIQCIPCVGEINKFSNPYVWLVFVGVAVLSTGLYMVLIWAMVADSIDYQEKRTGW